MPQQDFDLIKEFGLEKLPADKKAALQTKILELIDSRFNRLILERLSEADKLELDQVLAKGDPESMNVFMSAKVPDYAEIQARVVAGLKVEMLQMRDALLTA